MLFYGCGGLSADLEYKKNVTEIDIYVHEEV